MMLKLCLPKNKFEYFATISGSLPVLTAGFNLGWTSPYLPPILEGKIPGIQMTSDEGSWCAVMALLGAPVGALFCFMLVDRIGRKSTTLILAPIAFAMFVMLAFVKTTFLIFVTRFILGSVEGGLYTALPMYFGEISSPSIRGLLSASLSISMTSGTLLINVLGIYFSIFGSSIICSFIPVVHFMTFMWMPESPYYLMMKARYDEARTSLEILRGDKNVEEELKSLQEAVTRQASVKQGKILDLFTVKSNRRAVVIFITLNTTKKYSGKNPFLFYTTTIFEAVGGSLDPQLSVIIFIAIEVMACIVTLLIIDRVGRRPIAVTATIVCGLALACTGLYFLFKDQMEYAMEDFGWLPITSLVIFNIAYTMRLELTPAIFLGELFPTSVKAAALGMADTFSIINGTVASKLFQILMDHVGIYLPFLIFSACCIIGVIFIVKYVPETKNKTLEEIQLYLIKKTSGNP